MQRPKIFDKSIFDLAKKLPEMHPEPFRVMEEYDRTLKLKKWDNKIRVNFTLDPKVYGSFRTYCEKNGYKMSTLVERLIRKTVSD